MGGPDYPGCGLAVGVERLMMLSRTNNKIENFKKFTTPDSYVAIAVGKENKIKAIEIISKIREKITSSSKLASVDFICRDNLSKGLRYASEKKAAFAIIIGQEEILNKEVTIKNLQKRTQKKVKSNNIAEIFNEIEDRY